MFTTSIITHIDTIIGIFMFRSSNFIATKFILLITTPVTGILTFMSMINFMLCYIYIELYWDL